MMEHVQLRGERDDGYMRAVNDVLSELKRARGKFPAFNSAHEGYAVLLEEVTELWEEVRNRDASIETMRDEAMQIAAMAIRFMLDVCAKEK